MNNINITLKQTFGKICKKCDLLLPKVDQRRFKLQFVTKKGRKKEKDEITKTEEIDYKRQKKEFEALKKKKKQKKKKKKKKEEREKYRLIDIDRKHKIIVID